MKVKVNISRVVELDSAQLDKGLLIGGMEALDREIHRQWEAKLIQGWHVEITEPNISH